MQIGMFRNGLESEFMVVAIELLVSVIGAVTSIGAGIFSYLKAQDAKAQADRAVSAAESIDRTARMNLAAQQKRFFLEPREHNIVRVYNPAIENVQEFEVFSDQIPNNKAVFRQIAPGEHQDIQLNSDIYPWGLMHFTITVRLQGGEDLRMEYSARDIRPQWRHE